MSGVLDRRDFIKLLGAGMAGVFSMAAAPGPFAGRSDEEKTILFLSDTQAPMFWETLILPRTRNDEARQKILELVLGEADPAAVFHLGDVVARASEEEDWKPIDDFLTRLRARKVPVYGAMGNHEYLLTSTEGAAGFKKRFPEFPQSRFSVRLVPLAFIVLNSNFGELSGAARAEQKKYYEEQMAAFENDPEVKGVVVCAHHPPFTNSKMVNGSFELERDFVPLFLKSRKAKLFLSGHSHAAEHFIKGGKPFLVLGGGGGLLHPLYLGSEARHEDYFPLRTRRRWFHYLRLQTNSEGWRATFRMLRQDLGSWVDIYAIAGAWD
ncbi:MAG: metallophosphoesterase [Candidatus Aminicenantales bacterium]|jgi:predicted MPP superfamily phosphohydrolase